MKNNEKIKFNKKILLMFTFLLALIMCLMPLINVVNEKNVYAEETPNIEIDDEQEILLNSGVYRIIDANLYNALIDAYNSYHSAAITKLKVGSFKDMTSLNLSNKNITSIVGLVYFKFDNLTELNLSNNQITGNFTDFNFMPNLEKINLSNNKFNEFDGSFSLKLNSVNVSKNEIKNCNVSTIVENSVVDASFNRLDSFSKITLPQNNAVINLTHNLIVEDVIETTCTLKMGFQGAINNSEIVRGSAIKFYELDGVTEIKLLKKVGEEYVEFDSLQPNQSIENLSINYYKLQFVETNDPKLYEDILFVCKPTLPVVEMWQGDSKLVNLTYRVATSTKIKFNAEGEVYYKVNNGQKVKGNEFLINTYGTYVITYWQELEGMESQKMSFSISSSYIPPMTFVWILLGIIGFIGFFYLGYIFKRKVETTSSSKTNNKPTPKGFE